MVRKVLENIEGREQGFHCERPHVQSSDDRVLHHLLLTGCYDHHDHGSGHIL